MVVTLSGGVGELVYSAVGNKSFPPTTHFGDLGVDLARGLFTFPRWQSDFRKYIPSGGGRATVFGLMRHSTQVSGSTVYLADPAILPLAEIPIFGTISDTTDEGFLRSRVRLVSQSSRGGCVRVQVNESSSAGIRDLGTRISKAIMDERFPHHLPLIILVEPNLGKAFGQYISQWRRLPISLVVIDEIAVRDAQYVNIGTMRDQALPVSFFGLKP
jgi:ethanolamine utilization protein EutA